MLLDAFMYLHRSPYAYEVIVVDDGSSDETVQVVNFFSEQIEPITIIQLEKNSGKGAALRAGVFAAQHDRIVFADADGATPFAELERLIHALEDDIGIVIGSRAMPIGQREHTAVHALPHRKFLGRVFNGIVKHFLSLPFHDTQCGFKLFRREVAHYIFSRQQIAHYGYDLEVLYAALQLGIRVKEVPVNWSEVPGSKVHVIQDGIQMLRELRNIKSTHSALSREDFRRFLDDWNANRPPF